MRDGERRPLDGADDGRRGRRGLALRARPVRRRCRETPLRAGRHGADAERGAARRRRPAARISFSRNTGIALEWMQGAAGRSGPEPPLADVAGAAVSAPICCMSTAMRMRATLTGLPTLAVAHSDVLSWWQAVHGEAAPRRVGTVSARGRRAGCAPPTGSSRRPQPCSTIWRAHYRFDRRAGTRDPERDRHRVPMRRGRSAPRSWRPAGCGTRRRTSLLLDEVAAGLDWPVDIAGEANHPEGGQARLRAARASGVLNPAEMAERLGRGRDLRGAGALRAVRPRHSRSGRQRAARWCSATFRRCAKTGTARRCSCRPTMPEPGARRCAA